MTLKFLLKNENGSLVEAKEDYKTSRDFPLLKDSDFGWIDLTPTETIVSPSNLEYLTTKTVIDTFPCGNPIRGLIKEQGERINADYVITEGEVHFYKGRNFIAATFFKIKKN